MTKTNSIPSWMIPILKAADLSSVRCEFLADGATSSAWKLVAEESEFVLRRIDTDRALAGPVDAFVRRYVHDRGGRVAKTAAASEVFGLTSEGVRWSLDSFVVGFKRTETTDPVSNSG